MSFNVKRNNFADDILSDEDFVDYGLIWTKHFILNNAKTKFVVDKNYYVSQLGWTYLNFNSVLKRKYNLY